jgi:hypothetical protein
MLCSYNKGNRLFIGGGTSNIKYVDNGNFGSIQSSTINPTISGSGYDIVRFFESGTALYSVINSGYDYLYKSTDNGLTWNLQTTTYTIGANTYTLNSNFIIGTPNGNIFFLKNGNSDDVYLSTNGGVSATKIPNGLPSNAIAIGPLSKILVNGNKVWYQVKAANSTDFVRTDTTIAGLYTFNDGATALTENKKQTINYSIYPNPSKDVLNIRLDDDLIRNSSVIISNLLGEEVLKNEIITNNFTINTSVLNPGVYFIKISNKEIQSTQKIIIE